LSNTLASRPSLPSSYAHILSEKKSSAHLVRSEIISLSLSSHVDSEGSGDPEDVVRIDVRTEDIDFESIDDLKRDAVDLVNAALFHDSEPSDTELSIVLCSDGFIQGLNNQWREKNKPTDVLSFPQDDADEVILGDLVISIPTATRQVCIPRFSTLPSRSDPISLRQGGRTRACSER
jgi:hypothetical protein